MDKISSLIANLGQEKIDGSSVSVGVPYQDIPAMALSGERNGSVFRARRIMELVDMSGKTVADLGCSVGTMTSLFGEKASYVIGYDHDHSSIMVAAELYNSNVHFEKVKLDRDFITSMPFYDVVVWTSQFMWMVKQHGIEHALDFLWILSTKCNTLVFETAGKDDGSAPLDVQQDEVINFLLRHTIFQKIKDCGPWNDGWAPRNVFVCTNPLRQYDGEWSSVFFHERGSVLKVFKDNPFSMELKKRESECLKKLAGYRHFPKILWEDDRSIKMNYIGPRTEFVPDDDLRHICNALGAEGITHRDIRPENVLWDGFCARLVDFSFATVGDEITNYHYDLGGEYKCPYGFNDEYSLRKVQAELIKGR